MFPLSRFHLVLAFIALMMLRVVVGFHFFKEGTDKLKAGTFTAKHFLKAAKGPLAPMFHKFMDDPDGAWRFGLQVDVETGKKSIDPELTRLIWDDFLDRSSGHYQFGDPELIEKLTKRRTRLAAEITQARSNPNSGADTLALESMRKSDERSIIRLSEQTELGEAILESHVDELDVWFQNNRAELLAFFETADRVHGFDQDGPLRRDVLENVDSLREQVDLIKQDRQKQLATWSGQVDAIWDSYERQILELPIEEQANKQRLVLHRPFSQENSKLRWIDRVIPWFDTIVGALLMLGLFTRLASLAGALFLMSVIASQPPWVAGTEPTYFYAIELFALLVIFATLAGRMGGLDFFLSQLWNRRGTVVAVIDETRNLDLT